MMIRRRARRPGRRGAAAGPAAGPAAAARALPARPDRALPRPLDDSIALLKKELEINPANAMALSASATPTSRQSKWDEAIGALQRSVWINPDFSGPYILLGRAYTKKGEPATAEGMLRRAVELDPNNRPPTTCWPSSCSRPAAPRRREREFEAAERLHGRRPAAEGRGRRSSGLAAAAPVAASPGRSPSWTSPTRAGLRHASVYGGLDASASSSRPTAPAWPGSTTTTTAARRLRAERARACADGGRPDAAWSAEAPDQPPLPQPRRRDVRGRDRRGRPAPHRLGLGRLRGRLRQRRPPRPVRDLLRPERPLPQPRRRLRGRHRAGRPARRAAAVGLGLQLRRLRPRRPARPLRLQLPVLRRRARAGAGRGATACGRASRSTAAPRVCPPTSTCSSTTRRRHVQGRVRRLGHRAASPDATR